MPFFSTMPKKTAKPEAATAEESGSPGASIAEPKRPGTSGTELLLTSNRRTASENYLAAQRAEQAYKAKKRSAGARQHRTEAKVHFKQSAFHLKEGVKSSFAIVGALPWMMKGWKANKKEEKEKKARERDLEKKKKLEERLAKQAGLVDDGQKEE
jgi:hypothetical protein